MKVHKDNIKFIEEVAFQKGKLEAINKIDTFMKQKTYCKESGDIIRILPFEWEELKEQLQKEIGDDSQQPRMKQTRGGELKSDEGLHSTDNGSPADTFSELWDNSEDDRWDKEYNPDLLPETLKNKEEKQDE